MDYICKGCSSRVVKPVICFSCEIASHPGCVHHTGHPFADGQFTDYGSTNISLAASFRSPSRSPSSSKNSRCCWITRDWLSRKTCKTFSKLNLVYLNPSLWKWLTRADQSLILKSPHYPAKFKNWKKKCQACRLRLLTSGSVDGVIAERTDRERRKNNIILYNLEEFSYLLPSANSS